MMKKVALIAPPAPLSIPFIIQAGLAERRGCIGPNFDLSLKESLVDGRWPGMGK